LMAGLCGMVVAGSLDSPMAPSSGSGMYTLSQTYDYLNSGIDVTPVPAFQEPGAAPGPTMKTTKQIYEDIKAKYIQCDASPEQVMHPAVFFSTDADNWGIQTGNLALTGDAEDGDVVSGKTFYSNSWTRQTGTLTQYPPVPVGWDGNCIWKAGDVACPDLTYTKHTRVVCLTYGVTGGGAQLYVSGSVNQSCVGQGCSTPARVTNGLSLYAKNVAASAGCSSSQNYSYCCK